MTYRADISDIRRFAVAVENAAIGRSDLVQRQLAANRKSPRFSTEQIAHDQAEAEILAKAAEYLKSHANYLQQRMERAA